MRVQALDFHEDALEAGNKAALSVITATARVEGEKHGGGGWHRDGDTGHLVFGTRQPHGILGC